MVPGLKYQLHRTCLKYLVMSESKVVLKKKKKKESKGKRTNPKEYLMVNRNN